jgi:signal transduction histidine kinase
MGHKDYLYDLLVHDLTGPLSVVATTAKGLLSKTDKYGSLTEGQRHCLQRIARNTKKAQLLLGEILDVGRSEEHLFKEEHFLLEDLAKDAILSVIQFLDAAATERLERLEGREAVGAFLLEQGISMEVTGKYKKSTFFHDRRKVQLILENLISNALKYRKKSMKVSISGEGDVLILVSDDGCGIPKGEQEAVYKRFKQLKRDDLPQVKGLGLGLFCVKALVETMEGEIAVTSGEGCGTSFTVRIPPLRPR